MAAIVHLFGLFLLRRVKVKMNHQPLISTHLAVCELMICLYQVIKGISELVSFHRKDELKYRADELKYMEMFMRVWLALMFVSVMLCIAFDRVLAVHLHIKYYVIFTFRRVSSILNGIWLVNALISATFVLTARYIFCYKAVDLFAFYFFFAVDISFALVVLATYMYLYSKVRQFSKVEKGTSNGDSYKKRRKMRTLLPCLLIGTYLTMNVPNSAMFMTAYYGLLPSNISIEISMSLIFCGMILDGFLYIILQRDVRKILLSMFRSKKILYT